MYNHDSRVIFSGALKIKIAVEKLTATTKLLMYFKNRGINPKILIINNEYPTVFKDYLCKNNLGLQLVFPKMQQINEA